MTGYVFAPAADADLVDIWFYTVETWNQEQADRYTTRVVDTCRRIAAGQVRGKPVADIGGNYFKASVGSHFVVYKRDADLIVVVRILHQRMDIQSHIQE
jgi:toxin ParE1/3/4